ncbi:MAG: undecaprenyl-phosphate glucose phosphotransferase [Aquamicrobium sp.]|uniref:undecaprenyl-phosphate glucose phosphotransferase n=1 Tax=Aquamicrobium sp. TaxID=1872579 RepID=UPI00349E64C5|nr:undecaprenyl-phosphate glucose phosphotransferase [Aquamicrobium sp.]
MTSNDPANRYTAAAIRAFAAQSGPESGGTGELNAMARQIAAQYRHDTLSPAMVSGIMRLVEFAALMVSGYAIGFAYLGLHVVTDWHYPILILIASSLAVILLELTDAYQIARLYSPLRTAAIVLPVWIGALALTALGGFFLKVSDEFSRFWAGAWFLAGFALLAVLRLIVAHLLRRWARDGRMERRAVIVGGGQAAEKLIRSIEKQPYNDIRICGIFDDRDNRRSPPIVAGYPKLGTVSELIEFARITRIDMLIVSLPLSAEARVLSLLKKLWVLPVDIRLSAHSTRFQFRPRTYSYLGSVPMLDIFDRPIHDWDSVAKRAFDIVFSLLGIVVFSPVMLATALAVKLDSKGPALFKQKRLGFNNETIEVYKFRSMYVDQSDQAAAKLVTKGDPRVTRVGRFIRKASLDELPQFFNVLKGDLSLVGPRPHAAAAKAQDRLYHEVVDGYFARHRVKPGVTGWAQINGWRGETDSDTKILMRTEFDLAYIENWSLWLDLKILFLTPLRLLKTENAY